MIKKIVRQWLCKHKKTTPIKQIVTECSIFSEKKWLPVTTLYFKRWDKCSDCGKTISFSYKNNEQ